MSTTNLIEVDSKKYQQHKAIASKQPNRIVQEGLFMNVALINECED